ncbi:hypothetical protein JCM10207_004048 [Rhodosporidiobolus poonsookiae]
MSTSNFLHRQQQPESDAASLLAARFQQLFDDQAKIALSQSILHGEYNALVAEMNQAATQDPKIYTKLQAALAVPAPAEPTLLPLTPFQFDEDLSLPTLPTTDIPDDSSPLFGAVDTGVGGISICPLNDIPSLADDMSAPALPLPNAFSLDPSVLDLGQSVPASNFSGSSAGSPFSSPPTSYSCSPVWSPFDLAAGSNSFGSWMSQSSLPFHSLDSTCSSMSSGASMPLLQLPSPPALFPTAPLEQQTATMAVQQQLESIFVDSGLATSPVSLGFDDIPLARMPSQAGPERQRWPSELSSRFSPMAPPPLEYSRHQRQASVMSCTSSLLASPEIKPLGRSGSSKKTRTARVFQDNGSQPVEKNTEHWFAVHVQTKNKLDTNDSPVTRLTLDPSTLDPSSPLARAVFKHEPYTPASFHLDCTLGSVYTFYTASRFAYTVTFALSGPTVAPSSASTAGGSKSTQHTFLHFLPGDIVTSPSELLGSIAWWRLQECRSSHRDYPGSGAWTARFDGATDEAEKRRPARIYSHFAKCHAKGCEGAQEWSLMKLAKVMKGGK